MPINNADLDNYLRRLLEGDYSLYVTAPVEPPAIRVNTLKSDVPAFAEKLRQWQVDFQPHPINPTGFILKDDQLPLSHTLAFFLGEFFYHGVASQLPVLALEPQPGETILDISAAPGSKATQIAALMKNSGRLVLNDPSPGRNAILTRHSHRAGIQHDVVLRVAGQQFGQLFPEFFDRVLVDAPCTGLGTFASQPDDIIQWWSYQRLKKLADIQYYLLVSAIKATKVNGTIVYATCSIAPEENELVIHRILKDYPVAVDRLPDWRRLPFQPGMRKYRNDELHPDIEKALRTSPVAHPIEGFFIIRLKKVAGMKPGKLEKQMTYQTTRSSEDAEIASILARLEHRWGIGRETFSGYRFVAGAKRIWLLDSSWEEIPDRFLIKAGLLLAEKKLDDWKLTNSSIQVFKSHITNGLLPIEARDLKKLFASGRLAVAGGPDDYYVLNFKGENIASASLFAGILKVDLPHQFDLVV